MGSEDAIKAYKAVVRWGLDFESMASFSRTCHHMIRKCYLGAEIETSIIVADHLFAMSPRLQWLDNGVLNVPGEPCVVFVSTGTRWID